MLITINDDFDLKKIADSGQSFRCADIGGMYRFMTGGDVLYLKKISDNVIDASCSDKEWDGLWSRYFDMERDYGRIRQNITDDLFIARAADYGSGIRILRQDPWEMLITFIISQRKSIPAIKKAVEALAESCGEKIDTDYETLYAFPSPEALYAADESTLRSCGLGYRVPYITDAASKVIDSTLCLEKLRSAGEEEMRRVLKSVKGVGDKVASCIMLFAYGRTSSVPVDTWIKKIISVIYGGENVFLKYGENAGIAQQYAFYYIINHKDEV